MLKIKQKMISIFIALAVLLVTVTMGLASVFATPAPVMAAEATETLEIFGSTGTLASDGSSISWSGDHFTFTHNKGSSTSNIYTTDTTYFRAYANTNGSISANNNEIIKKIVITCTSNSYATACATAFSNTAIASSSTVTITPTENLTDVTYTSSKQWRLSKLEVTYVESSSGEAPDDSSSEDISSNESSASSESSSSTNDSSSSDINSSSDDNSSGDDSVTTKNITFELGENGDASHSDGGNATTTHSETVDGYTLSLTNGIKMYTGARDAKGNSCIKLGTSSAVGGFSFTVPDDVTKVSIAVAKYKANTTKIIVNDANYTLTKNSDNGEYDLIEIDTSITKTVDFTTVSGGYRAMVNAITFVAPGGEEGCKHVNKTERSRTDAKCEETGEIIYTCPDCGKTITETIDSLGHDKQYSNVSVGNNQHRMTTTCSRCTYSDETIVNCTSNEIYTYPSYEGIQHQKVSTCTYCEAAITETEDCSFQYDEDTLYYTCSLCGNSYTETNHTISFNVPEGITAVDNKSATTGSSITLPENVGAKEGYIFYGWTTEEYTESSIIYKAGSKYTVTGDQSFYALYKVGGTYKLVTNASSLSAGDIIVIAASSYDYALSTNQKSSNRGADAITKTDDTITLGADVQILTLEAGTISGTFAFNTGSGYLYAASSSGNQLKTHAELDNNASWLISISEGVASIVAQGDSSRNVMQYNPNNDNPLFNCYASASQKSLCLYKEQSIYTNSFAKIDSASLTIGEDITVNYKVSMSEAFTSATMKFTVNGEEEIVESKEVDGKYVFSLELPPQCMTDTINATLVFNGLVLDSMTEYSIQTYAKNQLKKIENGELADTEGKLKQLLTDMLYYGAAAQNYKGYNTTKLATDGVDNIGDPSTATPDSTDFTLEKNTEITSYPAYFKSATVWFDNVNKIRVTLSTTENVTLTINGEEVEVTSTTVYTEAIKATDFDKTYTFVLSCNGVEMQTLTYSVNAYAYAMQQSTTASESMKTLALALYRYGVSAEAYAKTYQA